jgi:AcrR family transcriptional regulator
MKSLMAAVAGQGNSTGKQRVLEAAQHLFAEGSYGDIGVAQIIERAGVQAPTLYHHFGDKEGLFVAWAEMAFGRVENAVTRMALRKANAKDALCSYASAMLATVDFDVMQVLRDAPRLNKGDNRDRVLSAYMSAVYEPLATLLVQATAMQELRQEPIGQLTDVFLGGLLALRNSHVPVDAMAEKGAWWCDAFVRAFAAP